MASPLISAARTDLQDTEKLNEQSSPSSSGGKNKKKTERNWQTAKKNYAISDHNRDMIWIIKRQQRIDKEAHLVCFVCVSAHLRSRTSAAEQTLLFFRQVICEWSVRGRPEKNRKTGPSDDFRWPLNIFRVAPNRVVSHGQTERRKFQHKIPAAIGKKEEEEEEKEEIQEPEKNQTQPTSKFNDTTLTNMLISHSNLGFYSDFSRPLLLPLLPPPPPPAGSSFQPFVSRLTSIVGSTGILQNGNTNFLDSKPHPSPGPPHSVFCFSTFSWWFWRECCYLGNGCFFSLSLSLGFGKSLRVWSFIWFVSFVFRELCRWN